MIARQDWFCPYAVQDQQRGTVATERVKNNDGKKRIYTPWKVGGLEECWKPERQPEWGRTGT